MQNERPRNPQSGEPTSKKSAPNSKNQISRIWCFTINNYNDSELSKLEELVADGVAKYCVVGKEVGESGTPHLQGTIRFNAPKRFTAVQRMLGGHLEVCRNPSASIAYCKKEGDFSEFGTIPKSGQRTDIETAARFLIERRDLREFKLQYPGMWVKYPRGFGTLLSLPTRCPGKPPFVKWLHGPTGTGKTRQVVESEEDLWISGEDLKWFDGYDGQRAVLFDDFRADFCKFHTLLRYLDRYQISVPVKGGFKEFAPDRIYITSNKHPATVYNRDAQEDIKQLLRRIDEIREVPFPMYVTDE